MAVARINTTTNPAASVCVVEPDPAQAQRIAALLGSAGVHVRHHPDGRSALADPLEGALCMISEMVLPDMSGADLISALRARGNHTPVILLAAESDVSSAVAGIRAGALDYIDKTQMERLLSAHLRRLIHEDNSGPGQREE
jgi:two-component system response regulator FixJ